MDLTCRRPAPAQRCFRSDAVEGEIARIAALAEPELAWLFGNCFPNTLDTTVRHGERDGGPDTFVITGDIDAMWLRDSTAQVWPYLPLCRRDAALARLVAGVVRRQAALVRIDPYANAFNDGPTGRGWQRDQTAMKPELHERKWEIDSLCYVVRLAHGYWRATDDASCFDGPWCDAMLRIMDTLQAQQRLQDDGPYRFQRNTSAASDTLPLKGLGHPGRPCGLIFSAFRPSDDACSLPFLVPANAMAVVALEQLAELWAGALRNPGRAARCRQQAEQIRTALAAEAVLQHRHAGEIWAYEVDGYGSAYAMDDANVPSLLSLPYLGFCAPDEPRYQRTRAFVLSRHNPYHYAGSVLAGVGGPHVGHKMVWPIAITMRALTSTDAAEVATCLRMLVASHAGTGFMHEGVHQDNPAVFTRSWFAWANTLFGELVLDVAARFPALLRDYRTAA
jgi:hypothetical protein